MADNKTNEILNVPNLRFPEFKEEWKNVTLKDVSIVVSEKIESYLLGLNNYISTENMRPNFGGVLPSEKIPTIKATKFEEGDILVSNIRPYLKKIWNADRLGGCSPDVFVFRANNISPTFLYYELANERFINYVMPGVKGVKMPRGDKKQMLSFKFSIPQKDEQVAISNLLRKLDERIATQNRIIEDLKKLKFAIIHQTIDMAGDKYSLSTFIEQVSERNRNNLPFEVLSVSNKFGFVSQSEQFEDREIASADKSNYKIVGKDVFAYNPARINIGSIARMKTDSQGIVSPMYVCFKVKEGLLPQYLEYYFDSTQFHNEMNKRLEGSVRLCLLFDGLCNIKVRIPQTKVQQKIVNRITSISLKIDLETKILCALQKERNALLQSMFI